MARLLGILSLLVVAAASLHASGPASINLGILDSTAQESLYAAWEAEASGDLTKAARLALLVSTPEVVRVRVLHESVAESDSMNALVKDSLAEWEAAGVSFLLTESACPEPHLTIVFRDRVQGRRGPIAGKTTTHRSVTPDGALLIRTTIEIATRSPFGGLLDQTTIRKTLLHEVGHFMGLRDVDDPRDVMGPVALAGSNDVRLEERHLQAVLQLNVEASRLVRLSPAPIVEDPAYRRPVIFTFPS
jgi:hypothetical protein